jgi:adenylate cyclase
MATNAFTEKDLAMLQGIAQQASIAVENSRLVEKIEQAAITRQKFERMLSPNLVEQVVSGDLEIKKGGELRKVAVLFSDIRGFTSLSEKAPPQDLVKMLNEYFEVLVDQIFETQGTLDKFIGDAIMAIWSAPVDVDDAAFKAVSSAVKIQKIMSEYNQLREMDGMPPIHTGIGVDTGEVVAGYMGSTKTMSYTVVGATVNRTARLCSKAAAGEVLISEDTYHACGERLVCEERAPVELKGISKPVRHWNVKDVRA